MYKYNKIQTVQVQNQQSEKEKRLPSLSSYILHNFNSFLLLLTFLTLYPTLGLSLSSCLFCSGPCFPKIAGYLGPLLLKLDAHPKLYIRCKVATSSLDTSPRSNWASVVVINIELQIAQKIAYSLKLTHNFYYLYCI